jgi:YgiT-type zinc finger domain-containing protein
MKENNPNLVECMLCGKSAARRVLVSKIFGRGVKRVLIEDIPTYHCRNCQGQYVDGATLDEIDKIRTNPSAMSHPTVIATAKLAA